MIRPYEVLRELVREHVDPRFVEPEEVAGAIAYLASPAAITGACLPVDLGALA